MHPAIVPAIGGRDASAEAPARVTIAATESPPATISAMTPRGGRRYCAIPAPAEAISTTRARPASRAILSYSPKVAIANSLNGCGTMSMTNDPIARIGLLSFATSSATSSATARNTAALTMPASAAQNQNLA